MMTNKTTVCVTVMQCGVCVCLCAYASTCYSFYLELTHARVTFARIESGVVFSPYTNSIQIAYKLWHFCTQLVLQHDCC